MNNNGMSNNSMRRRDNVIVSSRSGGSQGEIREADNYSQDANNNNNGDINAFDSNDVYGRSMKEEDVNDRIVLLKINMNNNINDNNHNNGIADCSNHDNNI